MVDQPIAVYGIQTARCWRMRRAVSSQEQELQMDRLEVIGRKAGGALPEESQMEAALRLQHRHSPPHHLAPSATTSRYSLLAHTLLICYDDRFCPDQLFLACDTSVCCVRRCSDIRSRPTRFDAR